jgi:hypothetical protein
MEYVRFNQFTRLRTLIHLRSINDGVLIDFSGMKSFSYDAGTDSITIEPGALWGEVYDGLQAQGVAPVGGRQRSVLMISIPASTL